MQDDASLWKSALEGSDSLAVAALDRFCMSFGSVAGDLALAHGASALVITRGVGQRLADRLPDSGFRHRFTATGRFEKRMGDIPVKLITHPQRSEEHTSGLQSLMRSSDAVFCLKKKIMSSQRADAKRENNI